MYRMFLRLLLFFLWCIQESHGDRGICEIHRPVLNICTDHAFATTESVFLDTVSVPRFQYTSCECIISPFNCKVEFSVIAYGEYFPEGMQFKINDIKINGTTRKGKTDLLSETRIYFTAARNDQIVKGICVNVYTEDSSNFNITCMRKRNSITEQSRSTTTVKSTEDSMYSTTRNTSTYRKATDASTSTTKKNVTQVSISSRTGTFTTLSASSSTRAVAETKPNTRTQENTRQTNLIKSHGDRGLCSSRRYSPVVNICTDHVLASTGSVFLDTVSVPRFQHNSCKCILAPFNFTVKFSVKAYGHLPNGMQFEINNIVINGTTESGSTYLMSKTPFYLTAPEDVQFREGACVNLYTEDRTLFNITCMRTEQSISTTSRQLTEAKKSSCNVIIPLVTTISGIVCLTFLIAVIISYKRRKARNRPIIDSSKPTVDQDQDNDYYMTENPMYNVTETQPNVEHPENMYHYIDHTQLDGRRSFVQYESTTDYQVGNQPPTHLSKHTYDYTTCEESAQIAENTNTLDDGNGGGKKPSDKVEVGENMYDNTIKAAVKQFSGMNEYHHLMPTGSSTKFVLDTYNTVENIGIKEEKEKETDVTHSH